MAAAWMIDELAYAGAEHLDPEFVAAFDRKQGHPDFGPDLDALAEHGLDGNATVVEFGAGTGRFALAAAERFGRVIATDVSPAMLAHLEERRDAAGLANLDCVRAGFLSYRHEGPRVDAVYTRHALHQLPDFWKGVALRRIADLLRPGGLLLARDLIYDFAPGDADAVFADWFDGAAEDPARGYTRDDYVEHIRTEHSTYRRLFEALLAETGFETVWAEFPHPCFGAYLCRRPAAD